ncbi:hypothetical protein SAMN04488068_2423 [Hydrocarboniphaga daqingensis]|uniref:Uncharacterized protein n=1 Tax=Hydrocarboniphaga daqingensis TaxID=490188 RepID=A0A1M5Q0B2_9GAMM|nr:hypothetical protein [Hydrocarboniphaga daqingensis]SHH07360.1 hypothetical protein SAMN04488068_2423 [Hydrocarboniphaga daqingensis]
MELDDDRSPAAWLTLRELDQAECCAKGSAFRAFKRIETQWTQGRDYQVLHHDDDRAAIARWREAGRIYASTVNLLLLSPPLARAVRDQMRRMTTDPAE